MKGVPTADLSITLTGFYQHDVFGDPNIEDLSLDKKPLYGDLTVNQYVRVHEEALTAIGNLVVEYHLPWATFTSSSSYAHNTTNFTNDNTLNTGVEFNAPLRLPPAAQA